MCIEPGQYQTFGFCHFMQVCKKCGSKNIILHDVEFMQFWGCYDCGENGHPYGNQCCKSKELVHIMVEQSNGSWVRRTACKTCKSVQGKNIQKGTDYQKLPTLKKEKREEYQLNYNRVYKLYTAKFNEFHQERARREKLEWKAIYDTYIKSEKWRQKAAMVRKRDNNICQACLSTPAQAVHHITYEHIYNEPLFDLVSICHKCHSSIHNK